MGSDVGSTVLVDDSGGFVDVGAGLTERILTWRRSGLLGGSEVASDEGVFQVFISSKSQQRRGIKNIFGVSVSNIFLFNYNYLMFGRKFGEPNNYFPQGYAIGDWRGSDSSSNGLLPLTNGSSNFRTPC